MKHSLLILVLFLLAGYNNMYSQSLLPSMVSNMKIILKATSSATTIVGNKPVIKVTPEISVSLKGISNVSKIHFEILEQDSTTIVYKANYDIHSSAVIQSGIKLFERNNLEVFFSTPSTIIRDKYLFKLYTEDGTGNLSEAFIQSK